LLHWTGSGIQAEENISASLFNEVLSIQKNGSMKMKHPARRTVWRRI